MESKKISSKQFPTYDAFRQACPSHTVLEVLANKWPHLIICALLPGTVRFGELSRKIEGITPKMLSQTLRTLERDGLILRTFFPVIPPRVEYQLTDLGQELVGLLNAILQWSEQHVPDILKARERADASARNGRLPVESPHEL
jgi:DNA-binding HxlR family transcriptional regulator